MYDLLDHVDFSYPSYLWSHSGWIETLDAQYDVNEWIKENLKVHVIPFSHNDPGWKMTYSMYFDAWSKNILSTVLRKLVENEEMTFVWSEVVVLKKWFIQLSTKDQELFRRLLRDGRFEILTGGMVMVDEAIVHYEAMLEQLIHGQQWLKRELNYSVQTAWSIDSFGHSPTLAYLLKKSGINRLFIQRTHYAVKQLLASNKKIEFYWNVYEGESLFTHMSPFKLYSTIHSCGPDMDVCCQFDFTKSLCWRGGEYVDADEINDDNVKMKSEDLLEQLRKKVQFVEHNNVYLLVGDDFSFKSLSEWDKQWQNMMKLFNYLNTNEQYNVQFRFSTIGNYLQSAEEDLKKQNCLKQHLVGDFFPYSDRSDQYWSGFYSSRPFLKLSIRKCQSLLRLADLLLSFSSLIIFNSKWEVITLLVKLHNDLFNIKEEYHLFQHHDTITGTSTAHVVADVLNKIDGFKSAIIGIINVASSFLFHNVSLGRVVSKVNTEPIYLAPDSSIRISVLNPHSNKVQQVLKILINSTDVMVVDGLGKVYSCQINPVVVEGSFAIKQDLFELLIEISIEAFNIKSFTIMTTTTAQSPKTCTIANLKYYTGESQHRKWTFLNKTPFKISMINEDYFDISNNLYTLLFCTCSGQLQFIEFEKKKIEVRIEIVGYRTGLWFKPFRDKSGAYIFFPNGHATKFSGGNVEILIMDGVLESSVFIHSSSVLVQVISLFHGKNDNSRHISLQVHFDISAENNLELALRIKTSIQNENFYTDLNGFKIHKRKYRRSLPISGNFYPISNCIFIQDTQHRVSLISETSHAGSSLHQGELEILLDRKLNQDDWRGLNEGIVDNRAMKINFKLIFETISNKVKTLENLSYLANSIIHSVNNPFIQMINTSKDNSDLILNTTILSLPKCIFLVSFKILYIDALNKTFDLLLTLLFQNAISQLNHNDNHCGSKKKYIHFSKIFGYLNVVKVYETNLSGTNITKEVEHDYISIKEKEFKSWLIVLE